MLVLRSTQCAGPPECQKNWGRGLGEGQSYILNIICPFTPLIEICLIILTKPLPSPSFFLSLSPWFLRPWCAFTTIPVRAPRMFCPSYKTSGLCSYFTIHFLINQSDVTGSSSAWLCLCSVLRTKLCSFDFYTYF